MTTQVREEILNKAVKAITKYGYNDEYGYYSDWADGVRPIIEKSLSQARQEGVEEAVRFIEDKYELGLEAVINYFKSKNLKSHDLLEQGGGKMKIYDESDRCPMCNKQPDEADGLCDNCGVDINEGLCPNCHVLWEDDSDSFECWKCGYDKKTGKVHKLSQKLEGGEK